MTARPFQEYMTAGIEAQLATSTAGGETVVFPVVQDALRSLNGTPMLGALFTEMCTLARLGDPDDPVRFAVEMMRAAGDPEGEEADPAEAEFQQTLLELLIDGCVALLHNEPVMVDLAIERVNDALPEEGMAAILAMTPVLTRLIRRIPIVVGQHPDAERILALYRPL